jgi:uncharacterized repeat protein (TIGR03987 family)
MLFSVILITLALVFYSIGVWSERLSGRLKGWHLAFFWAGFACDTAGTGIMVELSEAGTPFPRSHSSIYIYSRNWRPWRLRASIQARRILS